MRSCSWWDETQDAGDYINPPILDPDPGFGGNGTGADQCVTDGPFANSTLTVGPTRPTHQGVTASNATLMKPSQRARLQISLPRVTTSPTMQTPIFGALGPARTQRKPPYPPLDALPHCTPHALLLSPGLSHKIVHIWPASSVNPCYPKATEVLEEELVVP